MLMPKEVKDNLCATIRATVKEFGKDSLSSAVIIGPYSREYVSDLLYLTAPTILNHTIGNVSFKIARFFEDFYIVETS